MRCKGEDELPSILTLGSTRQLFTPATPEKQIRPSEPKKRTPATTRTLSFEFSFVRNQHTHIQHTQVPPFRDLRFPSKHHHCLVPALYPRYHRVRPKVVRPPRRWTSSSNHSMRRRSPMPLRNFSRLAVRNRSPLRRIF